MNPAGAKAVHAGRTSQSRIRTAEPFSAARVISYLPTSNPGTVASVGAAIELSWLSTIDLPTK